MPSMLAVAVQKVPSLLRFTSFGFGQELEVGISGVIGRLTGTDMRKVKGI